ncbi:enoyl-CoA hydratase/isomerase family protein [Nioella sediminis]|uniref:enoyl-CoA hydratase/isomerase family protein n=1 Tax=Nioella sediminis TaxID=1912092 RepID=UPI0008FD1D8B|nr:enoyl-CoA hydratase/isomerase family protein [Nioella sediminis]TBX16078.1 enoyl-CoA hydratase [Roseovarius sp. JS7-11]
MIDLTKEGGLWTVTLNRPDKANSLTAEMLEELAEIAESGAADDSLRAFVLTGAGDRVFSAGADLEAAKAGLAVSPLWERMSGAIAALPCLTIAALNGTLAGGAFGMALACDIRIAVPEAKLFYPVAKLGYLPQPSDPGRLAALVGPARARMILLASQKIGADEALQWGLLDRIVAPDVLLGAARDLAAAALDGNPDVLQQIKRMCP